MTPLPDQAGVMADTHERGARRGEAGRGYTAILVGGGALARGCLKRWQERGHSVRAVVTDDEVLREQAQRAGLRVLPLDDPSGVSWRLEPVDFLLSIVNLKILGPAALALGTRGAINFHDAPLPGYVGLNCPAWAIYNGESAYAVTWHQMTESVDAGDVLLVEDVNLDPTDTAYSLNAKCYEAGLRSFDVLVEQLEDGSRVAVPQEAGGKRRRYGHVDRPRAGGWLDPGRPARDLEALAHALDFGPERNPLGLPALVSASDTVLVGSVTSLPALGEGEPGTVNVHEDGIRMRTVDGDVFLAQLTDFEGRELTAPEALARLEVGVGSRLPALDGEAEQGFTRAARAWLRYEEWWAERVASAQPLELSYLEGSDPKARAKASVRMPQLAGLAADAEVEPPVAAVAVLALLLARLADKDTADLPITHPGLEETAGPALRRFSAAVPLRVSLQAGETFPAFAARLAEELELTKARGTFPRDLVRRSATGADPGWARQEWPIVVAVGGAAPPPWRARLRVDVDPQGGYVMTGGAGVGEAELGAFAARLEAFASELSMGHPVTRASVLSADDRRLLARVNATHKELPEAATIHEAIAQQARLSPKRTAVIAGGERLSYERLLRRAHGLARELHRRGVEPGDRVGLMCRRSADLVVALLAILEAGAAYVPLDPEFPSDRLEFMARDADLAMVLTDADTAASVPANASTRFMVDSFEGEAEAAPSSGVATNDLAYVIYTSGSTGRPKGVMLEHGNVLNFFTGIDEAVPTGDPPGTFLAVTSISFDISVLELLWTLARGYTVVLYDGHAHRVGESPEAGSSGKPLELSLFYFSADAGESPGDKYRLLLDGARFADRHGFAAVWTPERHFHAFGGLYPNPAVTGAAVAAITEHVRIRAGSCVLPLHSPIRIAEEWAVVDNISGGRVDISFASGWQPNDFVLAPDAYEDRHDVMQRGIETVKALWRGEKRFFDGPGGRAVEVGTLPRPVQTELPIWVTAAGNPATFRGAGELGAGLLTHLLGQDLDGLSGKIEAYRQAWRAAGHPGDGHVSLMLHTFVAPTSEEARAVVWEPLREYLRTSTNLMQQYASTFPAFRGIEAADRAAIDERFRQLGEEEVEALLDHACQRYYETSGLFGTVDECAAFADKVQAAGVDEIACLIDFGIPTQTTLAGLEHLALLLERLRDGGAAGASVPDLVARHGVSRLQCTPSMAQMLVREPQGRAALEALDTLLVGGEALPRELARTLTTLSGRVLNMYGPTETTIWSTYKPLEADGLDGEATVPIGVPLANTQVYVCDRNLQPLPPGSVGELLIGGRGVARGYWQRPETTAERFVEDELAPSRGGAGGDRLYRTGDLVRFGKCGNLAYLGRLDFQVKIRGHRIELGEIEAVLDKHPSVQRSVVAAHETEVGDIRLVAYVQGNGGRMEGKDLKHHVARRLPAVMVPSAVVQLDEFPLTPNGKIDRRALPAPVPEASGPGYVAPTSELEEQLAEVWRRVLSIERVGVTDDFFAVGGNSLLAVFLTSELARAGMKLTLGQLLKTPTVAGLARFLTQEPMAAQGSAAQPAPR